MFSDLEVPTEERKKTNLTSLNPESYTRTLNAIQVFQVQVHLSQRHTTDGMNTFHCMGIIAISAPCLMDEMLKGQYAAVPVPRCPRRKVAEIVSSRGIPILHYAIPQKSGLCSMSLNDWSSMKQLRTSCGMLAGFLVPSLS